MVITIDGPVGSGKSSVAKELAKRLNIYYLNTGLLYRATAYIFIYKLNKKDFGPFIQKELDLLDKISYEYENNTPVVSFENQDLTSHLSVSELDLPASAVSSNRQVRERLLSIQRKIAEKYDVVAEGRDCGSVVFPNADYKFFLTANLDVRAKRVLFDERRRIENKDIEKVKAELEQRDQRDKTRKVAPLAVPNDAILMDNSDLTFEQTMQEFMKFIR